MPLEAAHRVFYWDIKSSVKRRNGKQEDQRQALALRMTKAESGLALVAGKSPPLALSYLVLLQASQQHGLPCGKRNTVWLQKRGRERSEILQDIWQLWSWLCKASQVWSTKLCFAEVYWFIQIVSPVKYNLMLGMDELLASVLVTHLDVTLLGLFLPNSAGDIKGRDLCFYTTSTTHLRAPQSKFLVLVLHPECSGFSSACPGQSLGTRELREVTSEAGCHCSR